MTDTDIETVIQKLDNERIPIVNIKQSEGHYNQHYLSDEIVQETIEGLSSFDCIIILRDDLETFTKAIGGPFQLPSDVEVYANPCRGYRVWGTTFHPGEMEKSKHRETIEEEGHSITCERTPPYMHPNKNLILDLSRIK